MKRARFSGAPQKHVVLLSPQYLDWAAVSLGAEAPGPLMTAPVRSLRQNTDKRTGAVTRPAPLMVSPLTLSSCAAPVNFATGNAPTSAPNPQPRSPP